MSTFGRVALAATIVLPLVAISMWAQQKPAATPRPVERSADRAKPVAAKPIPPLPPPAQDPERIERRREKMKQRDDEIDRMMKQKAKKN